MRIKIKKWYSVFAWQWDVPEDEVCGICRVSFDGCCPSCKYPGDECRIVIGVCQHAFHLHCIHKWLDTEVSKGCCPMCRGAFKLDENKQVNIGASVPEYEVVEDPDFNMAGFEEDVPQGSGAYDAED